MDAPFGTGNDWLCHDVPFHVAAAAGPTASQKVGEVQDTESGSIGSGIVCSCHETPFHDAARPAALPDPSWLDPTASHEVAAAHEMPTRRLSVDPDCLGTDWRCQDVPFHLSARIHSPELSA
jgi:hypothetical protein